MGEKLVDAVHTVDCSTRMTKDSPMPDPVRPRFDLIDWARGLVVVLMALDHTRDFVGDVSFDAVDPNVSNPAVYATRWVTHLCAPTFVLLTGVGAYLARGRGRTTRELSVYLLTRGVWLIMLEFTLIHTFWELYHPNFYRLRFQVIAAIGFGMIALAGLVWLPARLVGVMGAAVAFGHNLLDPITPAQFGHLDWMWRALHETGEVRFGAVTISVPYPVLPWAGVIALGYGCGELVFLDRPRRRATLVTASAVCMVAFVCLRVTNLYGDPNPWSQFDSSIHTAMSVFNCSKYPPSAAYLWATLGVVSALAAAADGHASPPGRWLITFGRVPLFFYLIHLPVVQLVAMSIYLIGRAIGVYPAFDVVLTRGMKNDLWVVYLAWLAVLVLLHRPCHWFARRKATGLSVVYSYV
jgi:uncharacterized membrane protein